jgi:hypothetical protein
MLNGMPTTKLKLKWLNKRKQKYLNTINLAFIQVKQDIVSFLNGYKGEIDALIKYLAKCVETDDVQTFIALMKEIIEEAKKCKGDPAARKAFLICSYILLRLNVLSKFTLKWTTVKLGCDKCGRLSETNFLYTNKLCPYCGNIILKMQ